MKTYKQYSLKILITIFFLIIGFINLRAINNGLALTPPMGWNSWNKFGCSIDEQLIRDIADSIVSKGLKDAGYTYVVIDDCWQMGRGQDSVIIADTVRFPSGIKALADYVHFRGLKFGIYSDAGTATCQGKPGSDGYETIDAKTYAGWGVDYLKYDWCNTTGLNAITQYTKMSNALIAAGRPILFSICEWGTNSPWLWGKDVGNMWRITEDIQDCVSCTTSWGGKGWALILDNDAYLSTYAGPGHWNDPDMLEVGNGMTTSEDRAHFSMWCMLAAPLIAGNDIRTMSQTTHDILTAPELIAIDQDSLGAQATRVKDNVGIQVWQKPLRDSSVAVTLLNLGSAQTNISITWKEIGLLSGDAQVRNLWSQMDLGTVTDSFLVGIPTHDVVVIKVKGEKDTVSSLSIDNSSLIINKGNNKVINVNVRPFTTTHNCIATDTIVNVNRAGINQYTITAVDTGNCMIIVSTDDGKWKDTCKIKVIPSNLPSMWKFTDIAENVGSATYDDSVFSVEGGGNKIGGSLDQFAFLNTNKSGNMYISARLISQTSSDTSARAGLMFRQSTSQNSKFIMLSATPDNKLHFLWRYATGGASYDLELGSFNYPGYLKLQQTDTAFTAFQSEDGAIWNVLGSTTIMNSKLIGTYLLGLGVVSHNLQFNNIAKFDNVEIDSILSTNIQESHFGSPQNNDYIGVRVYPNPNVNNSLTMEINNCRISDKIDITISDIEGRLVYKKSVIAKTNSLNIFFNPVNMSKGVYQVSVTNGRTSGNTRLVVY